MTTLFDLVKASNIFSSLDDVAIAKIIKRFEKISLTKNKILFRQGELSDGLYVLVSGRLIALLKPKHNPVKVIGIIDPGQTVGELGAISHEPRTATVKTVEDSVLLKLSVKNFSELCNEYPPLILETMNSLVHRSRNLLELFSVQETTETNIVIFPANEESSLTVFTERLQSMLGAEPDMTLLTEAYFLQDNKKHSDASLNTALNELKESNKKIIFLLSGEEAALTKLIIEKSDMIYVVAEAETKPVISLVIQNHLRDAAVLYKAKPELVILHAENKSYPVNTTAWLKLASFGLHHHIRVARDTDWQRLLRFFAGNAVGIVLGGGGVRSWAHIGALKALAELGMPIDAIGGSSGGSIVAGYFALHETSEDLNADLHALSVATRAATRLRNLTWPAISLFNGKTYTEMQKKIFGSIKIENLWLPFFCISCSLAKSTQVINRAGQLWKKIRASTAVPGIFPPMVVQGKIHFDGGLVNNLPVDAMRKLSPRIGLVIAVELIHLPKEEARYKFPPILPFWETVLTKLRILHRDYRFPHFMETFLRSLLIGSSVKQRETSVSADILIQPDLSDFSLLSITPEDEKKLIEIGYELTKKSIKKWRLSIKKTHAK